MLNNSSLCHYITICMLWIKIEVSFNLKIDTCYFSLWIKRKLSEEYQRNRSGNFASSAVKKSYYLRNIKMWIKLQSKKLAYLEFVSQGSNLQWPQQVHQSWIQAAVLPTWSVHCLPLKAPSPRIQLLLHCDHSSNEYEALRLVCWSV